MGSVTSLGDLSASLPSCTPVLPQLSLHPRCSRAWGTMAKVSLELMRAQLCRCRLKIQGATKRAPPPLGEEPEATPPDDFLQKTCVRTVRVTGDDTFRELHHWAVSMCDHHGILTLQCYTLLRSEIGSTHLQTLRSLVTNRH